MFLLFTIGFVLFLQPRLQLRHALVGERILPLLDVGGRLIAEVGVHRGQQGLVPFAAVETIAEFADGAGVNIGPLEPVGCQYFKLGMHGLSSLWES